MRRKGYDLDEVVDLIVRHFLGELDENEQKKYRRMTDELELGESTDELKGFLQVGSSSDDESRKRRERAYRRFRQHTHKHRPISQSFWLQIAAVAVLLIAVGGSIYRVARNHPESTFSRQDIFTAQSKAFLVLADGTSIGLDRGNDDARVYENNVAVCDSGLLAYKRSQEPETETIVYNKVCVPRGGEYRLVLSDGTGIWINADTELKYPIRFGSGTREVYVRGEAYFEVTKDTLRPFVVHTSRGSVKVLGTEFNVRDYDDEQAVVTTLVKGNVEYRNNDSYVVLNPGDQAIDADDKISLGRVNPEEYVGWKDGKYIFSNETLANLMKYVERTYDVTVFFANPDVRDLRFSGDLQRYDRVELFLRYLESSGDMRFEVRNRVITVYKK